MLKKNGFTLIELLVVVSIIAVLSAIGLVSYNNFLKNARDARRQSDLRLIQSALERYKSDKKYYPVTLDLAGYLNTLPADPGRSSSYLYAAYKPDKTACDVSDPTKCLRYCLYARPENTTQMSDYCPNQSGYNLEVPSPD